MSTNKKRKFNQISNEESKDEIIHKKINKNETKCYLHDNVSTCMIYGCSGNKVRLGAIVIEINKPKNYSCEYIS